MDILLVFPFWEFMLLTSDRKGFILIPNWEHFMHLVGKNILGGLKGRTPETDTWVSAWVAELEHAIWAHKADLIDQFPSVREQDAGIYIFEVGLAKCWLEVRIVFPQKIARIIAILGAEEIDGH